MSSTVAAQRTRRARFRDIWESAIPLSQTRDQVPAERRTVFPLVICVRACNWLTLNLCVCRCVVVGRAPTINDEKSCSVTHVNPAVAHDIPSHPVHMRVINDHRCKGADGLNDLWWCSRQIRTLVPDVIDNYMTPLIGWCKRNNTCTLSLQHRLLVLDLIRFKYEHTCVLITGLHIMRAFNEQKMHVCYLHIS